MKSINKITALMLAVVAMAFTACSEKGADYDPAVANGSDQVYFSNEDATTILLNDGQTSFTYDIYRTSTDGPCTVTLTKTTNDNIFTIPASVTFADGQSVASFPVTFDFNYFLQNADQDIPLAIAINNETTEYGSSVAELFVKYAPWTEWYYSLKDWKKAGYAAGDWPLSSTDTTCTYTYAQLWSGDDEGLRVYFRKSLTDPAKVQFMIDSWGYGIQFIIDGTKATKANGKPIYNLVVKPQFTGYTHSSYGDVYVSDDVEYWVYTRQRYTLDQVNYDICPCTYDPETGDFLLNLVYYVDAGYFGDGEEICLLDGYVRKDYSLAIAYAGGYINGADAGAVVNMTMGADVAKYRYVCVPGALTDEQVADYADKIFNEDIDAQESAESGAKLFSLAEDGDYTVVAVIYDDEGNKVGETSYTFTYKYVGGAEESWTPAYVGTYTYTVFFGSEDDPAEDPGLVFSVSDKNPNRYKISNIFYGVDFIFEMNDDYTLTFEDQFTGYTHPTYGDVYVGNLCNYSATYADYPSYYDTETGEFVFCVVYFVEAGYFGMGYETFVLTGYAAKDYFAKTKAKKFTPMAWNLTPNAKKVAKRAASIKSKDLTKNQVLNGLRVRK